MNDSIKDRLSKITHEEKLSAVKTWYGSCYKAPLHQGEENEITRRRIDLRLNQLSQISRIKSPQKKKQWEAKVNRMYYYNVILYPLEVRLKTNYVKAQEAA